MSRFFGGGWIGKTGYGYSSLSDCEKAFLGSLGQAVCNWNGTDYQPYSVMAIDHKELGKTDFGFSSFDLCIETIQASRNGLACNWAASVRRVKDL